MPFITEELYQNIKEREERDSIMVSTLKLDAPTEADAKIIADVEVMKQIVAGVRAVRNQKNIAPKEALMLQVLGENPVASLERLIKKMANVSEITSVETKDDTASSFLVGTTEFAVPLGNLIDTDAEIARMEAEVKRLQGFLVGVQKKLSNERFVANAPAQVVELEKKKQADAEAKIASLTESIAKLRR